MKLICMKALEKRNIKSKARFEKKKNGVTGIWTPIRRFLHVARSSDKALKAESSALQFYSHRSKATGANGLGKPLLLGRSYILTCVLRRKFCWSFSGIGTVKPRSLCCSAKLYHDPIRLWKYVWVWKIIKRAMSLENNGVVGKGGGMQKSIFGQPKEFVDNYFFASFAASAARTSFSSGL